MTTIIRTILHDIIDGTALPDLIQGLDGRHLRGHDGDDVSLAGSGTDIREGGPGNDRLVADAGGDQLFGGGGSDILVSGSGADLLNGGTEVDAASYEAAASAVSANLSTGRATVAGVTDTLVQVENLIGSQFSDALIGDAGANELFGAAGNDTLNGGGAGDNLSAGTGDDVLLGGTGDDRLRGEAGNDRLDGGTGRNQLDGGDGSDTVDYSAVGTPAVNVNLHLGTASAADRRDFLSSIENAIGTAGGDQLLGGAGANRLDGRDGADVIGGGGGNDVLLGGAGADRLHGGEDDDFLEGGAGADVFVFAATTGSKFFLPTNSGADRIADFDRAEGDRIDLTAHKEATTFADLRATASQLGTDTHLRLGDDTIMLDDVALSELSADMFLF